MNRPGTTAWGLFAFCVLVWGSSFILIKQGLVAFSPLQLALLRVIVAGLVLLPLAVPVLLRHGRRLPLGALLVASVSGSLVPSILFATAQTQLSSSLTGLLNSTTPLATFAIGVVLFGVKPGMGKLVGLLLGLAGAVLIILRGQGLDGQQLRPEYAALVLLATLSYGFNANWVKARLRQLPPLHITAVSLSLVGVPLLLPLLLFTKAPQVLAQHTHALNSLLAVAALGAIGTAFTLVLFYRLLQTSTALFASSVTYLIPGVALLWGLADGESLQWTDGLGMAVVLLGVWLVGRTPRPRQASNHSGAPKRR